MRSRVRIVGSVGAVVLVVGLAACGDDQEKPSAVEVAQAKVDAAKEDLADAEDAFAEDSEEFCGASQDYILALDRYGDVLSQTAVTVGDVVDAGSDLEEPRDQVDSAADAATASHADVLAAEQALADAKADLAQAKNPDATPSDDPSETPDEDSGEEPLLPPGAVSRVEQAERELAAVQRGIADETPLSEASQQFNAAVVALEMSWLQLFADAGCLTDEQQAAAQAAVHDFTATLQGSLAQAGFYEGEVDGAYGPQTVDAVQALQEQHGLPTTGVIDKATAAALEQELVAVGGASADESIASTASVQQTLKLAGYWDGPVDGVWTDALTDALQDFQTALGVEPTGAVDAATVRALETAIAEGQQAVEDAEEAEEESGDGAQPSDGSSPSDEAPGPSDQPDDPEESRS